MKTQQALSATETTQKPELKGIQLVTEEQILNHLQEIYQEVEKRAYQFFEERGREFGYDLDDWLRAKSEFLVDVPVDLTETETNIIVKAIIPDFKEKEIQVSVKPNRVMLSGKKEDITESRTEEVTTSELKGKEFFFSMHLPGEVEASKAKTELKDGILKITIPKAGADSQSRAE